MTGTRSRKHDDDTTPRAATVRSQRGATETPSQDHSPTPGPSSSRGTRTRNGMSQQNRSVSQATPGPSQGRRTQRSQGTSKSQSTSQSQRQRQRRRGSSQSPEHSSDEEYDVAGGRRITKDEKVQNCVPLILMMQQRLLPIRKSDLIKHGMNKQAGDFKEIIDRVKDELKNVFGMKLIGMKNGSGGAPELCEVDEATSYLIVSKFRQLIHRRICPKDKTRKDSDEEIKRAALFLILSSSFMLDKELDEDCIWDVLENLEFSEHLCKKREDLKRFLKTEYVDTLYLVKHEEKDMLEQSVIVRYGWGVRSNLEISKYVVLTYVAKLLEKEPSDFLVQYSKISEREIRLIEKQNECMNQGEEEDNDESSSDDEMSTADSNPVTQSQLMNMDTEEMFPPASQSKRGATKENGGMNEKDNHGGSSNTGSTTDMDENDDDDDEV